MNGVKIFIGINDKTNLIIERFEIYFFCILVGQKIRVIF